MRAPSETVREAQRLLDAGMPFHAHEVFEDAWKSGPQEAAPLWRGLAQIAVGLTHAARGNAVGGARLLRRGADALAALGEMGGPGGPGRPGGPGQSDRLSGPGQGGGPGQVGGVGAGVRWYGIDVSGVVGWARELAGRVEAGGGPVDPVAEAPRLGGAPSPPSG
ncbi:DUF309 domain-containing protein [Streptomyces sp. KD18]|uniref:DUF309 domain-containing protein n=1 Tax=Streptomyces sp. KD18 TaxID=2773452 RepID=UPI00168B1E54|nr:DUF309 domain-containing protein [Streptomyces sp. KD18]